MFPLEVLVVISLLCTSKLPPSCGEVSSTRSAIALLVIPSSLVPSAARSRPSTLPVTATLPVIVAPVLVISSFVLPPVCNLRLPVPASLIIESLALWNISRSSPVPNLAFTLSLYLLSPVNVLPVVTAKLPVAVTPPCQAPPL